MRPQKHTLPRPVDYERQFEAIINTGVRYFLIFGVPAIFSVQIIRAMAFGFRPGAAVQLVAVAFLCITIALHRRLTFHRRMHLLVFCAMTYGAAGLADWGMVGTGLFLMFTGCILAALMGRDHALGLSTGLASVVITALTGLAYSRGWIQLTEDLNAYHHSFMPWFAAAAAIGVVSIIIAGLLVSLKKSWLNNLYALSAREQELTSILRNTPDIIFRLGMDNSITYINSAVTRYGYTPEELIGRPWQEFIHPADYETIKGHLMEGGPEALKDIPFEVRLFPKRTRSVQIFHMTIDTLFGSENTSAEEAFVVQGIASDITEHIKAQSSLREREQLLALYVKHTPAAVAMCDLQMRYLAVSHRWITDYGLEGIDLIGRCHYEVFPDLPAHWHTEHRQVLRGAVIEKEAELFRRSDGSQDWVKRNVVPWYDKAGRVGGLILFTEVITQRKEAEARLKRSEQEKAAILNAMKNVAIEFIDPDMNLIWANAAAYTQYGDSDRYLPGTPCYYGKRSRSTPCPDCTAVKALKTGIFQQAEITRPDGRSYFVQSNPVRDADGKLSGVVVADLDITDRKRAEEQLRRSERRMAQIIDFLPDPTFVIDTNGKVIAWNRAIEELTGVNGSKMLGQGDYAYAVPFYGERRPIMIDLVQQWNQEIAQKYLHIHEKNGILLSETKDPPFRMGNSHFWNAAGLIYDDGGQVVGAIESIRDITQQRAAEKALTEAEKRFRELVENLMVGVCIVQDDRPVYINPHYRVICGPLAATAAFSSLKVHPDDRRTFDEAYRSLVDGHAASFNTEFRLDVANAQKPPHRLKWLHCIGSMIKHQQRPAVLISMVDITRTKELEKMIRLQEKMASLGQVSTGIAHEIRNPLSGINVLLDGIRENFTNPENTQDIMELIDTAQKASTKISAVINRVLDFARPSLPCYKRIDINDPLRDAVALSQTSLRKSGITLETHLDQHMPLCYADAQLIEQVVLNLISNAARAMKANRRQKKIRMRSWAEEDRIWLSLADSGNGIPEKIKDKVFEPFYTTDKDGSGIGLSICQRIVSDHGGNIDIADSGLGGAEFRIQLPLDRRGSLK